MHVLSLRSRKDSIPDDVACPGEHRKLVTRGGTAANNLLGQCIGVATAQGNIIRARQERKHSACLTDAGSCPDKTSEVAQSCATCAGDLLSKLSLLTTLQSRKRN